MQRNVCGKPGDGRRHLLAGDRPDAVQCSAELDLREAPGQGVAQVVPAPQPGLHRAVAEPGLLGGQWGAAAVLAQTGVQIAGVEQSQPDAGLAGPGRRPSPCRGRGRVRRPGGGADSGTRRRWCSRRRASPSRPPGPDAGRSRAPGVRRSGTWRRARTRSCPRRSGRAAPGGRGGSGCWRIRGRRRRAPDPVPGGWQVGRRPDRRSGRRMSTWIHTSSANRPSISALRQRIPLPDVIAPAPQGRW